MICEPLHHFNYWEIYRKSIVRSQVWGNVALSKWSKTKSLGWFVFHLQRTCLIIRSSISLKCNQTAVMMAVFFYSLLSQQWRRIQQRMAKPDSPHPNWCTPRRLWGNPMHHRVIKVMLRQHYGSSHKIIRFLSPSTVFYQSDWSPGHFTGWHNC